MVKKQITPEVHGRVQAMLECQRTGIDDALADGRKAQQSVSAYNALLDLTIEHSNYHLRKAQEDNRVAQALLRNEFEVVEERRS